MRQAHVGSAWHGAGIGLHAHVKLLAPSGGRAPPPDSKQNSVAMSQGLEPHEKLPASLRPPLDPLPPEPPLLLLPPEPEPEPAPASSPQGPRCAKGLVV